MSFFVPGRTRCAISGEVLHRRSEAARLWPRVAEQLDRLAAPGSEWVARSVWTEWPGREAWVRETESLVLATYADGPHGVQVARDGIVVARGPAGWALRDLRALVAITLADAEVAGFVLALDVALGGGRGRAELASGQGRVTVRCDPGEVRFLDGDDDVVEIVPVSAGRLAAWRAAVRPTAGPGPVPSFAGEGRAHRLHLSPTPAGGVQALLGRLRPAVAAEALTTGGVVDVEVLGGAEVADGVEVWLAGDLLPWRALARIGQSPAALAGVSGAAHVESRDIEALHVLRQRDRPWPITWRSGGPVRRLTPHGPISVAQLALLADHLCASFGAGSAWVDGAAVRLAPAQDPERALELVVLWAQRAWVDPQVIEVGS
jgi:hypothetical protein